MLETPVAMLNAAEIATASARLTVLVMGTNDLAKELHAEHVPGRAPLQYGLQACLMAARLAGKVILDGVYNDIKDDEGFRAECVQGSQFGFDGKTLIHPSQVEPCNDVFAPSEDEIASSREIIAAFEEAEAEGRGRRHRQRPHDREPARRQRPPHPRRGRRHRRAGLTRHDPTRSGWLRS